MATITNKTDGVEIVDSHGDTYFIKYSNVKLIKTDTLKVYDNSENRRGADAINLTYDEVTSQWKPESGDSIETVTGSIDLLLSGAEICTEEI